jgi:hypothetical protein
MKKIHRRRQSFSGMRSPISAPREPAFRYTAGMCPTRLPIVFLP